MEAAVFVLLGAFLGMVGGALYMLTIREQTGLQTAISLMVSCSIGTIASIALLGLEVNGVLMVAIIALGYAGTDFILSLL